MTIPEGWVLVPKVPTEAMLEASNREWDGRMSYRSSGAWAATIAAAPAPPTDPEIAAGRETPGVPGATYRLLARFDWREATNWARGEMLRRTDPHVLFDVVAGCIASVCLQVVGLFGRTQMRDAARAILTKASLILEDDIQKVIDQKKGQTALHNQIRLVR